MLCQQPGGKKTTLILQMKTQKLKEVAHSGRKSGFTACGGGPQVFWILDSLMRSISTWQWCEDDLPSGESILSALNVDLSPSLMLYGLVLSINAGQFSHQQLPDSPTIMRGHRQDSTVCRVAERRPPQCSKHFNLRHEVMVVSSGQKPTTGRDHLCEHFAVFR